MANKRLKIAGDWSVALLSPGVGRTTVFYDFASFVDEGDAIDYQKWISRSIAYGDSPIFLLKGRLKTVQVLSVYYKGKKRSEAWIGLYRAHRGI